MHIRENAKFILDVLEYYMHGDPHGILLFLDFEKSFLFIRVQHYVENLKKIILVKDLSE